MPFWINFAQKGYFQSKIENLRKTTKFSIFELVYIPSFTLNRKFCFFEPKNCWKSCQRKAFWIFLVKFRTTDLPKSYSIVFAFVFSFFFLFSMMKIKLKEISCFAVATTPLATPLIVHKMKIFKKLRETSSCHHISYPAIVGIIFSIIVTFNVG